MSTQKYINRIGRPLFGIVVVGMVWYSITEVLKLLPDTVLPSPILIFEEFLQVRELIIDNLWVTLSAGILGFFIALVLATALGTFITINENIRNALMPFLVGGNTIPRVAVAPLVIFYIDVARSASLIIAAWVAFFPILINVIEGLEDADDDKLEFFDMIGASTWQTYRYLLYPNALPYIFDAMKLGITTAMVGAIVGEFVTSSEGLGYMALLGLQDSNISLALAIVFVTGLATTILIYGVYLLEAKLMFWEDSSLFAE